MADDQKIENLLNLALGATAEERRKSPELMVGYDEEDQRWDIIVKYNGNILRLEDEEVRITELSNEYAIMNLPESRIDENSSTAGNRICRKAQAISVFR